MYCSAQLAPVEGSLYWWDRRLLPLNIKGPMRKEKCVVPVIQVMSFSQPPECLQVPLSCRLLYGPDVFELITELVPPPSLSLHSKHCDTKMPDKLTRSLACSVASMLS